MTSYTTKDGHKRHHLAVTLNHKTWLAVYKLAQKAELSFSAYCRKLIEDAVAEKAGW